MNAPDPSNQALEALDANDPGEDATTPARELAKRRSGTDEVLLLWHPDTDRVELLLHNPDTGAGFLVEVAAGDALDAFYHPFVYAARGESSRFVVEYGPAFVDA